MLKPNSHREYSRRTSQRRRGQALLLAVLVMVFVSLIGATFITVVALNIGQTQRGEEKNKARQAAQAGLAFANLQLTESEFGAKWRANDSTKGGVSPAASTDSFYWTPFDQAQGWNNDGYAKFPDPRSTNPSFDAPNYMVKVEKVLLNDPVGDNTEGDKTGALRITTIGQSPDNLTTFHKTVAYKAGPAQQPLTAAMRSVTNWDFQNEVVPSAKVVSYTSGTPATLVVNNLQGTLPSTPFYITVGDPSSTGAIRGQAVSSVAISGVGQRTLTLATSLLPTGTPATGERVEIAAAIGAPEDLDFNNDGSITATTEKIDFDISSTTTPGSVWTNGGLLWFGTVDSRALNSPKNGGTPGFIRTSGVMRRYGTTTPSSTVTIAGTTSSGGINGTLSVDSKTGFPGTFTGAGAAQVSEVIEDGWNRLANIPDASRQVKPFTPPNLSAGGEGLGRYRQMTKHSASTDSGNPQGGAYGHGAGIYINNPQDKERVGAQEMTQAELRELWFSDKSNAAKRYLRRSTPDNDTDGTKSLEQQHLRGWIAPAEFRPRGAFVQIISDNPETVTINDAALVITLDPRADGYKTPGVSPNQGPSPLKAWRNADGTLMGSDDGDNVIEDYEGGVYTRIIPWPANGVLFAEGNIRIGGEATNAPRSLTVVSMNNIYIEDSVSAGATRKVLLLAKKNVVVNPTRTLATPDAQSLLSVANTGNNVINVQNASGFRVGDWIKIGTGSPNDLDAMITNIAGSNLTLNRTVTAQTLPIIVRVITDPVTSSSPGVPYTDHATHLYRFGHAIQRRVNLPAGAALRLAIRHSAERNDEPNVEKGALRVTTSQGDSGVTPPAVTLNEAYLTNKLASVATPRSGIIRSMDKLLAIQYIDSATPAPGGTDAFPDFSFVDEAAARNYKIGEPTATDSVVPPDPLESKDDLREHLEKRRKAPDWKYVASIINGYDTNTAPLLIPPHFFLAAVGNRAQPQSYSTNSALWRENIFNGTTYDIPMATSVTMDVNGTQATFTSDRYNKNLDGSGAAGFEQVKQFGFNFTHGLGINNVDSAEDVLTADRTFYNNGHTAATSAGDNTYYTFDSRILSNATAGLNTLAFKLNAVAESYFNATGSTAHIPYYRLSRAKLENATFALDATAGTNELTGLDSAYTFNINAYVYAQEGSWFVIPGDFFDSTSRVDLSSVPNGLPEVRQTHVNLPHHNTLPSLDAQADENLDLDRDGVVSPTEQAAVYRYRRYNYKINFTGAIMENKSATVIDVGTSSTSTQVMGDVENWTDKWATVRLTAADFPGGTVNHSGLAFGNQFGIITYNFDPTAADPTGTLDADAGFHPPVSSELLYQTG